MREPQTTKNGDIFKRELKNSQIKNLSTYIEENK